MLRFRVIMRHRRAGMPLPARCDGVSASPSPSRRCAPSAAGPTALPASAPAARPASGSRARCGRRDARRRSSVSVMRSRWAWLPPKRCAMSRTGAIRSTASRVRPRANASMPCASGNPTSRRHRRVGVVARRRGRSISPTRRAIAAVAAGRREREHRVHVVERVEAAPRVELRFPLVGHLVEALADVHAFEAQPPQQRGRVDQRQHVRRGPGWMRAS